MGIHNFAKLEANTAEIRCDIWPHPSAGEARHNADHRNGGLHHRGGIEGRPRGQHLPPSANGRDRVRKLRWAGPVPTQTLGSQESGLLHRKTQENEKMNKSGRS